MVSLNTASSSFLIPQQFVGPLIFIVNPSLFPEVKSKRRWTHKREVVCIDLSVARQSSFLGFGEVRRGRGSRSWRCGCKAWESDGEAALEAEIMKFMKESEKPEVFPTKKELVEAGRMDLVDGIVREGGWMSLGWDLDSEDDDDEVPNGSDSGAIDLRDFQRRANSFKGAKAGQESSPSASPSGRSLDMGDEDDAGIEGILKRLEKQRNLSFGINLGRNGGASCASSKDATDHMHFGDLIDADRDDLEKISRLTSGGLNKNESESLLDKSGGKLPDNGSLYDVNDSRNSAQPEMWRTWSFQRAGFSEMEFEAAEISFNKNQTKTREDSKDEILGIAAGATEALDRQIGTNHNQIRIHLQHLEHELASALRLIRSKNEEYIVKGNENSLSDLQKLSDAWEFQETELMNAQDKLRSIRAKLAVLEGKMALAIIDAQKIAEEKQKSIDAARRALQLLRAVRIVWPNSASEVLLAGSFDGWTTKRKMEKSTTGFFSVQLKLYPGRYEIKFIVDGVWRIDPLRPIVHNEHENNLLIIT